MAFINAFFMRLQQLMPHIRSATSLLFIVVINTTCHSPEQDLCVFFCRLSLLSTVINVCVCVSMIIMCNEHGTHGKSEFLALIYLAIGFGMFIRNAIIKHIKYSFESVFIFTLNVSFHLLSPSILFEARSQNFG